MPCLLLRISFNHTPMPSRLKCIQLRRLPKAPTSLRSVNFRHTTPGSSVVLLTKFKPQPTRELFDPNYPGAHLSLSRRQSLAPRWVSKHFTLYAFPKAFLTKPDVPYSKPYKPRPYPERPRRPEQRSVDMFLQVIAFNSRVMLKPIVGTKIKRRLKEAVRLIVTRGAAVEESRGGLILYKWIVPGAYSYSLRLVEGRREGENGTYVALPTTEIFRIPFAEQIGLMRKALGYLHRHIPDVEEILKYEGIPCSFLKVERAGHMHQM
ncbi:hypothetical protein B0F90DRAFT_1762023 [Multifurca ochricompacta]|uniref:Uncharacterized protein n=1 Tax=Multifurca ochricompacta TaxID=376703 RepID=A0AAD4LXP7_9AGAM|nr:hypothetical protein B0F90DRAFT_1762023 [Multifurca ochricompacta]